MSGPASFGTPFGTKCGDALSTQESGLELHSLRVVVCCAFILFCVAYSPTCMQETPLSKVPQAGREA